MKHTHNIATFGKSTGEVMNGIQYLTDSRGNKKAVVIDLKKHGALWEDFQDGLTARLHVEEPRQPTTPSGNA